MDRGFERRRLPRRVSPRVLIVCEGQKTEFNYFSKLIQSAKLKCAAALIPRQCNGGSALVVVQRAVVIRDQDSDFDRRRGDVVYCVLDVESHDPAKTASLARALSLAKREKLRLLLSNPSFEVWLLAHAGEFRRSFASPAALDKEMQRCLGLSKQQLNQNPRQVEPLLQKVEDAVVNARHVREDHFRRERETSKANASTDVYALVSFILGQTCTLPG